ncbi:MAG: hypothetical protein E7384_00915 [Ruminococcaceae bacterium]|nr:hypothetical protein [Oscillospiraceae bacterium]
MMDNLKNHAKCSFKVIYCYVLGIILSWAAYPVLLLLLAVCPINKSLAVYSVFATLIFSIVLYISMHEIGEQDRKPYRWAVYKGKGFVCGAIASVVITLVGFGLILAADSIFYVQHPYLDIANINSYMKLIIYMPFFWFFEIIENSERLIPNISYLTALIVIPFSVIVSGIGYWTGISGINIIKKKDGTDIISKILYKDEV